MALLHQGGTRSGSLRCRYDTGIRTSEPCGKSHQHGTLQKGYVITSYSIHYTKLYEFHYQSGFLFLTLPSGRQLAYVKPRMGENQFGGEAVTYEGVGATKKWERLESYGPKFTENVVQAIARDSYNFV